MKSEEVPGSEREGQLRASLAGDYLTFKLADEVYGLEILRVREIIGLMGITRVPRAREHLRGVINLRGAVVPIVDLRLKFEMPAASATEQTVIIVVQCAWRGQDLVIGVLVDEVLEVLSIDAAHIEGPPPFAVGADMSFILGVGKAEDRVIFLLDIGKVLSDSDGRELADAASAPSSDPTPSPTAPGPQPRPSP